MGRRTHRGLSAMMRAANKPTRRYAGPPSQVYCPKADPVSGRRLAWGMQDQMPHGTLISLISVLTLLDSHSNRPTQHA